MKFSRQNTLDLIFLKIKSGFIHTEAGELAGTYTAGYNRQDMPMDEIKVDGNQLSFTAGNNQFTLKYTGTIEGDTMSGTMSVSAPQGSMDGSFTGTRSSD